jgi:hypothetical protein
MVIRTNTWKKAATAVLCAACIAALAACGQKPTEPSGAQGAPAASNETQTPAPQTPAPADENAKQPESQSAKTASDVFEKSLEASSKLNSLSISMDMKQTMEQGGDKMDIASKIDMDIVMKPDVSFKQSVSTNVQGQDVKMEMYLTKDGFFMKPTEEGPWMKMPADQMNPLMSSLSGDKLDPSKQLEKLKLFVDDFTLDGKGDDYIVSLSASGDKFNAFISNELAETMGSNPELGEMIEQSASAMNINKLEYKFVIDKKTYYPKAMNVQMDIGMDVQGETMNMVQQMDGVYTGYNNIKEIVVPQEALNAQTINAAAPTTLPAR